VSFAQPNTGIPAKRQAIVNRTVGSDWIFVRLNFGKGSAPTSATIGAGARIFKFAGDTAVHSGSACPSLISPLCGIARVYVKTRPYRDMDILSHM